MLGMKLIYMDAGAGGPEAYFESMIEKVASALRCRLIVGGGITNPERHI